MATTSSEATLSMRIDDEKSDAQTHELPQQKDSPIPQPNLDSKTPRVSREYLNQDESPESLEQRKRESALLLKLDLFIAPVMMLLMLISYLDRGNIGFAATQGMSKDIGLKPTQLNTAVSVFYIFYILAEVCVLYFIFNPYIYPPLPNPISPSTRPSPTHLSSIDPKYLLITTPVPHLHTRQTPLLPPCNPHHNIRLGSRLSLHRLHLFLRGPRHNTHFPRIFRGLSFPRHDAIFV